MDLTSHQAPRQRAPHLEYIHNRGAKLAVREIQEHLGKWQKTAATLRMAAQLGHGDATDRRRKASQINEQLCADRLSLDGRLRSVEPGVAAHSLPRDVRRAIDQLEADLRSLMDQ
jgi:hypothetical protein